MESDENIDSVMALLLEMRQEAEGRGKQRNALMLQLQEELQALNSQQTAMQTAASSLPKRTEATAAPESTSRPRATLPDIQEFEGDSQSYCVWKTLLVSKLEYDGAAIGEPIRQFGYIFGRLGPRAQSVTRSFYMNQPQERRTPEEFLQHLDSLFYDPQDKMRALDQLHRTRQRKDEPFDAFLQRFEPIMARCELEEEEGSSGDDYKVSWLRQAINGKHLDALFDLPEVETFIELRNQLLGIGYRLEYRRRQFRQPADALREQDSSAHASPNARNLQAGQAGSNGGDGAIRGVGRECYACHQHGHVRRNCPNRSLQ